MSNAEGSGVWRMRSSMFVFWIAFLLFAPDFAVASLFSISYSPTILVAHSNITLYDGNPADPSTPPPEIIVHASNLDAVNTFWTIEEMQVRERDVPVQRGVYLLERIDSDTGLLEGGTAVRGQNYDIVHVGFSMSATTTRTISFSMAPLGAAATPSGTYLLQAVEEPETKNVYDPVTDTNATLPFTDDDLEKFLTQEPDFIANTSADVLFLGGFSRLVFHYIADGPPPCTEDCFSNVLFLPGIESSRLYRPDYNGGTDKLWEPGIHDNLQDLYLTPEGEGMRSDIYAKEGDVLDENPVGTNIYKSFIEKMNDLKTRNLINDWEPIAYDWRLSIDDVLNYGNDIDGRIYYGGDLRATSTPYIIQELRRLAATSRTGKVTIITHSNGGLVAKRLTEKLGSEAPTLIDKIILVAVPQVGTPEAIVAGLHGEELGGGLVVSKTSSRTFASTTPIAYHLLPSAQYFTQVDDPVITFDPALSDWIAKYGDIVHSEARLEAFLTDSFGRVDAETGDTDQPIQLHDSLFLSATALHADLDDWTPPAGIVLIQIAGWGVPTTVEGITYKKKGNGVKPEPNFTVDGDGTVVVPSALWTSTTAGASNYWVDLRRYNEDNGFSSGFGFFPFDHSRILEAGQVISFISDIVTGTTKSLEDYTYFSTESPSSIKTRLRYALHSPLTLDLYDDQGRHTGVATSTGQIEENIPGTYFVQFGDVKYIFADSGALQHIVMSGYDTGTFTFEVGELQGDTMIASTTFKDVPVTPQTQVRFDVSSGIGSASDLVVDENGDGVTDSYYASSTGQRIVPAAPVPQDTSAASDGGGGGNGPPINTPASSTGISSVPDIATGSVVATITAATSTRIAAADSTSTVAQNISVSTSTHRVAVRKPAPKPPPASDTTGHTNTQSQVASAAQTTGSGLWSQISRWIMDTIQAMLKL